MNVLAMSGRGALIVFEGCDCSGKTSQTNIITDLLNNEKVPAKKISLPDRSSHTGKLIDSYLKQDINLPAETIHLLFAANRWELLPRMKELLLNGTTLILDRYSYSGIAYSCAKQLENMDLVWCKNPEIGLPKPDIVIYLHLDPDIANKRTGFGEERYEKAEFQKKVSEFFQLLKDDYWETIDADMPKEELTQRLLPIVRGAIDRVKGLPLDTLW